MTKDFPELDEIAKKIAKRGHIEHSINCIIPGVCAYKFTVYTKSEQGGK